MKLTLRIIINLIVAGVLVFLFVAVFIVAHEVGYNHGVKKGMAVFVCEREYQQRMGSSAETDGFRYINDYPYHQYVEMSMDNGQRFDCIVDWDRRTTYGYSITIE